MEFLPCFALTLFVCVPLLILGVRAGKPRLFAGLLSALSIVVGTVALLVPTNRYGWMGVTSLPYDCDNPSLATSLSLTTLAFGLSAALVCVRGLRRERSVLLIATLGVVMVTGLLTLSRIPALVRENVKNARPDSPCR